MYLAQSINTDKSQARDRACQDTSIKRSRFFISFFLLLCILTAAELHLMHRQTDEDKDNQTDIQRNTHKDNQTDADKDKDRRTDTKTRTKTEIKEGRNEGQGQ